MRSQAQAGAPRRPAAPADRRRTMVLAGLLAATAVVATVAWTTSSDGDSAGVVPPPGSVAAASPTAPPTQAQSAGTAATPGAPPPATSADTSPAATTPAAPPTAPDTGAGAAEADGTSPSVGLDGTDPGLQAAFGAAASALAEAGLELVVNSGYRTPEHQQRLLDEAVAEYGSYEEARRWVAEPERSMHVQGLAVDVGSGPAADWLQEHGAQYGICQTLDWEWWHFEWRQAWQDRGDCPPAVADPDDAPGVDVP